MTPPLVRARITAEHRGSYKAVTDDGETDALITGRMSYEAAGREELPTVGDWVQLERIDDKQAVIREIEPRRSAFTRKVAGCESEAQVVAANVDVVFVVEPFDPGPNVRRIERYLTVAWESGATPVVVLTKSDIGEDVAGSLAAVESSTPGVEVHAVSSVTGEGLDALRDSLANELTAATLGPSGAGKSSLINALAREEIMATKEIRWDGKGRHTTTHRQLISLPSGGAIIDTPGMRELQLWDGDDGIDRAFSDIAELSTRCKFNDCVHGTEPGCAVRAALDSGKLGRARFESYQKQLRELAAIARKKDRKLANAEAKKWKHLHKDARSRTRVR